MSTYEYTRTPRRPDSFSAGSGLRLVRSGTEETTGVANDTAVLGPDGTPVASSPADTADRCARHADELAGEVEAALRSLCEQFDALSDEASGETRERVAQLAWGQGGALRAVAGALGELHTVLDELAHELTGSTGGTR